jgi:sugar phosphate isomerase/epimerase
VKNYIRDEAGDGSWFTAVPTSMELGLINYREVVARALELGYSGPFLMEQYGGDSLGVCATNREYLRTLLPASA